MPHIEIRDVSLVYDTPAGQVTGVQSASFNIEQSEFLCIVGPSGCGKSTLLNIIAGFLAPTGGVIQIGGKAVKGYGQDRGVVFQDFAQLFPWRTALGNVAFGLEMKGVGKTEREEIAQKQLELVKLGKRHDLRLVDGAAFGRRASRQCRVPEDPALDHRHDVERGADHAVVDAECVRAGDGKALLVERRDHPEFPVDGMRRRQQLAERLAAQNV